jgi:hypothetical protein
LAKACKIQAKVAGEKPCVCEANVSSPSRSAANRTSTYRRTRQSIDEGNLARELLHYDLGYFDLEQKTLQPLDNPFGTRLSPMS